MDPLCLKDALLRAAASSPTAGEDILRRRLARGKSAVSRRHGVSRRETALSVEIGDGQEKLSSAPFRLYLHRAQITTTSRAMIMIDQTG